MLLHHVISIRSPQIFLAEKQEEENEKSKMKQLEEDERVGLEMGASGGHKDYGTITSLGILLLIQLLYPWCI